MIQQNTFWVDPAVFGASMDGVTIDDVGWTTAYSYAVANNAGIAIKGPMRLSAPVTVVRTVPVTFMGAGLIRPSNSFTINSPILGLANQIFDLSFGGQILGSPDIPSCFAEWFGALGDNATICTTALSQALAFATQAGINVQLLGGTYKLDNTVFLNGTGGQSFTSASIFGLGKRKTVIDSSLVPDGLPALKCRGGSGQDSDILISDIGFLGTATKMGLMFSGQNGVKSIRCKWDTFAVGVQWHNEDAGSFTEHCTVDDGEFTHCVQPADFKRSAGNDSFNLSGIRGNTIVNVSQDNTSVINIGAGCKLYNSPLECHVWTNNHPCTLISNNSTSPTTFKSGGVSYENNSLVAALTLGSVNSINYAGPMTGTNGNALAGTFHRGDVGMIFANSTVLLAGAKASLGGAITTGANTITSTARSRNRIVYVQLSGTSYDVRFGFWINHNGFGSAGYVTTLFTQVVTNVAGYGSPTPSVSTNGDLILTNAGFPASGVTWESAEIILDGGALSGVNQQLLF